MSEVKPVLYLGTKLVPYEERTFRIADLRDAMGYTHDHKQFYSEEQVQKLLAENERLRAEVERLTFEMGCLQQQYDERTAYMIVHRGAALACSDSVRAAYSDEHHRAERLAEALRSKATEWESWGVDPDHPVAGCPQDERASEIFQRCAAELRAALRPGEWR